MYWTWIIVSCILSLISLIVFVGFGTGYFFGDDAYEGSMQGDPVAARISLAGLAGIVLVWAWPVILPLLLILAVVLLVRGAFKTKENS